MSTSKKMLPENKLNYIDRNILHYLYKTPKLSDIKFIVNDKRFRANRCVMSAASDVFEAMLFGTFQESSSSDIKISDVVHTESFSSLLSYIYGFGIQVDSLSIEVVMEVLKLGHLYEVPKLCEALQSYVSKLDLEIKSEYSFGTNAFMELLNVAFTYKIVELYDRMKNIIKSSTENVNKFLEHSELVNITCPILEDIFEADNFCTEEVKIFGAVLKWIDANVTETDFDSIPKNDESQHLVTKTPYGKMTEADCSVKNSDSGIELSSDIPQAEIKIDEEVVTEHESDGTSLDECNKGSDDQQYSSETKTPSCILELLQTIRSSRMSIFDNSKFWKQNGSFCEKYEELVTDMIPCLNNENPRKPLIQRRILFKCESYIDQSQYYKSSDPVTYDSFKFYLNVSQNNQCSDVSVQLAVQDLDCNCSEAERSVSLNYSLFLKSFHPFYTGYFVERNKTLCTKVLKKPKPTPISRNHGFSFQSCPYCRNARNQFNIRTSEPNPEVIAVTSKLPNTLNQKSKGFIKNSSFILEAFIEFN